LRRRERDVAKRKPSKPYKGSLATPAPKYNGDAERWKIEVVVPKLLALLDHYGITRDDPEKWYRLAMNLAIDHVPHMAIPAKPGRKVTPRRSSMDYHLYWAVRFATLDKKKSVSSAIRHLTTKDPRFKGKNPGTLRDRYYLLCDGRTKESWRLSLFEDWLWEEQRLEREMDRKEERRREEEEREEERRREDEEEEERWREELEEERRKELEEEEREWERRQRKPV
jgi:hypothetical protein